MSENRKQQKQSSKRMLQIIMGVAVAGFMLCVGYIVYYYHSLNQQGDYYEQLADSTTVQIGGEEVPVSDGAAGQESQSVPEAATEAEIQTAETGSENVAEEVQTAEPVIETVPETVESYVSPIDFAKLQAEENADIYAWIRMDNTVIDYPVLQHPTDDTYYLMHNPDHSYGYPGCIYSELYNTNTFEDPVTVLYGHNMKNGTMFGGLHQFENKDFFDRNTSFEIYMPDKTLVYEIVAALETDDKRITVWYNFEDEKAYQNYIDELTGGTESELYHLREGVELTTKDKLVVLQTCVSERKSNRYVVVGALREIIQ